MTAQLNLAFYLADLWLIAGAMGAVLLLAAEVGTRLGSRDPSHPESARSLIANIGAATLGLLGLLLGFTLSMAISRWDVRRDVIVTEANAIGTLWLRAGLLEEPAETELRTTLRDYVGARIALAEVGSDLAKLRAAREHSEALDAQIWSIVERVAPSASPAIASALIASANEVIDLHELRMASLENYVPPALLVVLIGIGSIALGFLGWCFGAAGHRGRVPLFLLALLIVGVVALVMDLNRPHRGFLQVSHDSLLRLERSIAAPER